MIYYILALLLFIPKVALAHCPLCTVGAGALAVGAAYLGVSTVIVGIFIGAFALALGLWMSKLVKKEYMYFQRFLIALIVFLSTVIPIMPLALDYGPFYVSIMGDYGTIFHNTYTVNLYVFGFILGALIVLISPYVSKLITSIRGGRISYQGMTINFVLLVLVSSLVQFWSWIF